MNDYTSFYTGSSNPQSSPTVANGYVYLHSNGYLYQFDANDVSSPIHEIAVAGYESSPAVANGYVYVGSSDGTIYKLDASDVAIVDETYSAPGGEFDLSPAVANGYVYIGSDYPGGFYQLNASTLALVSNFSTGYVSDSAAVTDDYVYFGNTGHNSSGADVSGLFQLRASNIMQQNPSPACIDTRTHGAYSQIQDAVDAAIDGDTIYCAGSFNENVLVNKMVNIYGNYSGVEVSASDSGSPVFHITSNYVNITNFTVSGASSSYGIYLDSVSGVNVFNTSESGNSYGIELDYSNNNNILNNTMAGNGYGFYVNYSNDNQIGYNNVLSTISSNFGSLPSEGGSCPFLYTWNGTGYGILTDISAESGTLGIMAANGSYKKSPPGDYAKIKGSQLQPVNGSYDLQVTEESDEIGYVDQLSLLTIDHSSDFDVYPGLLRSNVSAIYTVGKSPIAPVSCIDANGKNCLDEVSKIDGHYAKAFDDGTMNVITLNFGDISNASNIKLILTGFSTYGNGSSNPHYIELLNASGDWVTIYDQNTIKRPSGIPRTYVVDLTPFSAMANVNNYTLRLGFVRSSFDYVAVDTTPQQNFTIHTYQPTSADLHFRGYSSKSADIVPNLDYNSVVPFSDFSNPSGNFTKYGDVTSLVINPDDEYAIMHHGDEISVTFPFENLTPSGDVRDFLLYSFLYFKADTSANGSTVDPLPFAAMSKYPYGSNESYPSDAEHQAYLAQWNTRQYNGSSSVFGGSLPYSSDNVVFNNSITGGAESTGLNFLSETDSAVVNNTISNTKTGIEVDSSSGMLLDRNIVSNPIQDGVDIFSTSSSNVTRNDIDSSHGDGMYFDSESSGLLIDSNNISNGEYAGLRLEWVDSSNVTRNNIVNCSEDAGLYVEEMTNSVFSGNNLQNDYYGMEVYDSSGLVLDNNSLTNTQGDGMNLYYTDSSNVTNNNFLNISEEGLYLYEMTDSVVSGNNVSDSDSEGMDVEYSSGMLFANNTHFNTTYYDGFYLYDVTSSLFSGNNVSNSGYDGYEVDQSTGNQFINDSVRNSTLFDFDSYDGSLNNGTGFDIGPIVSFTSNDSSFRNASSPAPVPNRIPEHGEIHQCHE